MILGEYTGTVSHGTSRRQDLIPVFLACARNTIEYTQIMMTPFGPIPSYVDDAEDGCSPWWDSAAAGRLLDELIAILDSYAPHGFCFCEHPDEPNHYGFWLASKIEEATQ